MVNRPKRKGTRIENELVERLREIGWWAEREDSPLRRGQGKTTKDVVCCPATSQHGDPCPEVVRFLRWESKARKDGAGFKVLERWLGDADFLYLRKDGERKDPMVAMRWSVFEELMRLV